MSGGTALQPLCVFGCGRMVNLAGNSCWPCQSYEEYLFAPRCDCPHDPNFTCRCREDCEEDCPALYEDYIAGRRMGEVRLED